MGDDDVAIEKTGREPEPPGPHRVNTLEHSNLFPEVKRNYHDPRTGRATKDDFIDQAEEAGSLWASGGQTNYYFIKNKLRNIGDIITLAIDNDLHRDIVEEIKESLSTREKIMELNSAQDILRNKYIAASDVEEMQKRAETEDPKNPKTPGTPGPPVLSSAHKMSPRDIDGQIPRAALGDINIDPAIDLKPGGNMTGEILERYPNGNYKIMAIKRVPYKHGTPRMVSVVGIVKGSDITDDTDIIPSGKLYDYKVAIAK